MSALVVSVVAVAVAVATAADAAGSGIRFTPVAVLTVVAMVATWVAFWCALSAMVALSRGFRARTGVVCGVFGPFGVMALLLRGRGRSHSAADKARLSANAVSGRSLRLFDGAKTRIGG